jgi:hypothetical protein
MVRGGNGFGAMLRPALGYGLTENFKVSVSAPVVFKAEPFAASRMSAFTSMSGDFEGLAIWRFHRQDTGVGSRFESAAIGGVLVPGPQDAGGALKGLDSGLGALAGAVTGICLTQSLCLGRRQLSALCVFGKGPPARPPLLQLRLCLPSAVLAHRQRLGLAHLWRDDG